MKHIILSVIVLAMLFTTALAETEATHILITNENEVYLGKIIEYTDTDIIFQKTDDDVIFISKNSIKQIKELTEKNELQQSAQTLKPTTEFININDEGKKYLKIPLFHNHKPSTKVGIQIVNFTVTAKGFKDVYSENKSAAIGFAFDFDYSSMASFTIKFLGTTYEGSGIDSSDWFRKDGVHYDYDTKWSMRSFSLGPRIHYQWSVLNPYIDGGLTYITIGQKGTLDTLNNLTTGNEYLKGYSAFGFCYGGGIQIVTPFSMTLFFEMSTIKVKSGRYEIGGKYIGGGFFFNLQ